LPESEPLLGVELSPRFTSLWEFGASPRLIFRKEIGGAAADLNLASGLLAVGDAQGRITLWSNADGELQVSIETGLAAPVRHLAFSDNGRLIAALTAEQSVGIWSIDDPVVRFKIPGHGDGTTLLRFIGSDRLATAGRGSSIKIWNLAFGKLEQIMLGHIGQITGLAISPDLRTLVSGSDNGDVKLWDLRTGQELIGLRRHAGPILFAEFSGEGRLLITGGIDANSRGEIAFWDAAPE
jgi:WD40 repeat protein